MLCFEMPFIPFLMAALLRITFLLPSSTNVSTMKLLSRPKRIVSGKPAVIEHFPYLVVISGGDKNSKKTVICGGSILDPRTIITAAHCFVEDKSLGSYKVRAGSSFRRRGGSVHRVRDIVIHENYSVVAVDEFQITVNDLALLRLEDPIRFDNSAKGAIRMFDSGEECKPGTRAVTAGWGEDADSPYQLRSVELRIVPKKACTRSWEKFFRDNCGESYDLKGGRICAGARGRRLKDQTADGEDYEPLGICAGDSGGPLVLDGRLAGVATSSAPFCFSHPVPDLFTEVAHYRRWIDEKLYDYDKKRKLSKNKYT